MLRGFILLTRALGLNARMQIGLIALIIGVLGTVCSFDNWKSSHIEPINIFEEEVDATTITDGQPITGNAYAAFDEFMTEEFTKDGKVQRTDHYYVLPIGTDNQEYYVGIKAGTTENVTFTKLSMDTLNYYTGNAVNPPSEVEVNGILKKMDSESAGYFNEYFEELEWFDSAEEQNACVLPYYIDTDYSASSSAGLFYICIVGTIVGIALFVFGIIGKKKAKALAAQQAMQNPYGI